MATAAPARAQRLPWRVGSVLEVRPESPTAVTLVLDVPGWPGHRPGQHVDVRLTAEDGYQAQRSYSIASPPEAPRLELTVERLEDGEVSPYLTSGLAPGDPLELRGPIGGWFVWTTADGGPLALVAGGSGVVPLLAMLRHRAAAPEETRTAIAATLLYSTRTLDAALHRAELERLADDPAVRVVHTITGTAPREWTGYRRRVDREMLAEVLPPPDARPHVFVCGPTPMVEATAAALVELGHDPRRVRTERFGPTGG